MREGRALGVVGAALESAHKVLEQRRLHHPPLRLSRHRLRSARTHTARHPPGGGAGAPGRGQGRRREAGAHEIGKDAADEMLQPLVSVSNTLI